MFRKMTKGIYSYTNPQDIKVTIHGHAVGSLKVLRYFGRNLHLFT